MNTLQSKLIDLKNSGQELVYLDGNVVKLSWLIEQKFKNLIEIEELHYELA